MRTRVPTTFGTRLQRVWITLPIYRKVLALYFICLIPVALFAGTAVESNAGQARKQVLLGALQTADIAAANASNFVEAVNTQLQMVAATPGLPQSSPAELKRLFLRYLSLDSYLDDLLLIDADGHIVAQGMSLKRDGASPVEERVLQWLSTRPGSVIFHAKDWFAGRQRPIILARPVRWSDQRATLVGVVAAWRLYRALRMSSSVQEAEVFLTDSNGDVIAHPNWMFADKNPNLKDLAPVAAALKGLRGTVEYHNAATQESRMAGYTGLPQTGWAVVVSYPEKVVAPPAVSTMVRGLTVLLLLLGAATAMAAVVGRHIVEPLEALTHAVEALAEGDFRERVVVRAEDEVGRLSAGFNRMAQSLEEMAAGLTRAHAEIEAKAQQLAQLLQRSVSIQEEERRRIALDLHDGILQVMVGALGGLQATRLRLGGLSDITGDLGYIEELLKGVVSEIRHIVYDLRPPRLETAGLLPALEQSIEEFRRVTDLGFRIEVIGTWHRLPAEVELGLFRAFQESMQNIVKHAYASHVAVVVRFAEDAIQVTVSDNGRGFSMEEVSNGVGGLGLLSMRERLKAVGGSLTVQSGSDQGTVITMSVPLPQDLAESEARLHD